jgi:hypothetical protein
VENYVDSWMYNTVKSSINALTNQAHVIDCRGPHSRTITYLVFEIFAFFALRW